MQKVVPEWVGKPYKETFNVSAPSVLISADIGISNVALPVSPSSVLVMVKYPFKLLLSISAVPTPVMLYKTCVLCATL